MKKFYIALLAGCVLLLSTIILVSCPATGAETENPAAVEDSKENPKQEGKNKSFLTVQFNAAQFDTSELAGVYPTFDTDLSGYSFTLTGECNSETYTLYNNVSSDAFNSPIELTDDTWNFELRAVKDGTLYMGTKSAFAVETGDNTADFTLTFNANHFDGTATMSLNLTYEQDSYKATKANVFVGETKCENVTVSDEGISLNTTVAAG